MSALPNNRRTRTAALYGLRAGALLPAALLACALDQPTLAAQSHPRQPWPLKGSYQLSGLRLCGNNHVPALGSPPAPTLVRTDTAQIAFTPAAKIAFADWLGQIAAAPNSASEPPGWQPDTPLLANTPSPSDPESPLQETAVEWGQLDMANFRSEIGAPGAVINDTLHSGPTWFFVTQYGFGDGATLDTPTSGHALYLWKDETDGWLRYVVSLNSTLTFTAASAAGHAAFQREIGGIAYYCLRQIQLHQ